MRNLDPTDDCYSYMQMTWQRRQGMKIQVDPQQEQLIARLQYLPLTWQQDPQLTWQARGGGPVACLRGHDPFRLHMVDWERRAVEHNLSQTEKAVADSFQDSLTAESYLGALTSTSSLFSSPTLRSSSSSRPSSLAPLPAPAFGATNNTPPGPTAAAVASAGVSPILGAMTPPATLPFDQGRDGAGRERPAYTRQSAFEAQGLAWSGQVEGEFRRQEEGQGEGKEE
ncbi:unnamed protein product [Closterium sp. NIES-53]